MEHSRARHACSSGEVQRGAATRSVSFNRLPKLRARVYSALQVPAPENERAQRQSRGRERAARVLSAVVFQKHIENIEAIGVERDLPACRWREDPAEFAQSDAHRRQTAVFNAGARYRREYSARRTRGHCLAPRIATTNRNHSALKLLSTGGTRQFIYRRLSTASTPRSPWRCWPTS